MSSTGSLSELDALRSQVADLSRQLAERDRLPHHQLEQSDRLRAIVEGTAAETGEAFFSALVTHLTSVLDIKYALIGEVQGDRIKKIRTIAVAAGGALVDNFEYELAHTPCAAALTQSFACFDRDLQATFPQFQRLADLGAESYCAVPLRTKGGAVIGLLVVMDTKPWQQGDDLRSLLEVFAPRVAAEFERRRAEQARVQALADLHNVIETIPDIVFALDTQGNVVKWNRRLGDVTGYSPEELLNKPALTFVPPEEQARTAAGIQRVFVEGYAELEGHLLTKDHRLIPYHWAGAVLKNLHGEPIGSTGIGRDVSDKKRAEEGLRRSEERLALAIEGSNDILWDAHRLRGEPWYAPQTPIWWSPRVREWLGLEESELFETLEQWAARLHPDDKDRVFGQLAAHIEQRVPYDVEYRLCTNGGDYLWLRGRGQAIWNEQGEPSRMSGSCQDITERKQVEKALCESEERYRTLIDLSPNGVFVYCNGKKVYVNQAACTILGASSPEQLIENPTFHFSHPDAYDSIHTSLAQILATDEPVRRVERKYQRLDGTAIFVEVDAGRIMWNGEPAIQVIFADITDRKQAEEALRASEERFHAAFRNATVGMGLIDLTNRIVEANQAFSDITGYSEAELKNLTFLDITHPDDRPANRALQQNAVKGKRESFEVEKRYIRKNGEIVWVHVSVGPIHDALGQVTHTIALITDITERKRSEDALSESEAKFRALAESTTDWMWEIDEQGRYTYCSPKIRDLLGYEPGEALGKTPFDFMPEDEARRVAGLFEPIAAARKPFAGIENTNRRKDGQMVILECRGIPVIDDNGLFRGYRGFDQDITERKRVEEERQKQEVLIALMLNTGPACIKRVAANGSLLHMNPTGLTLIESCGEAEVVGRSVFDLITPEHRDAFISMHRRVIEGHECMLQFEVQGLKGTRRWMESYAVPFRNPVTGQMEQLAVTHDITERKQAEKALRESEAFNISVLNSLSSQIVVLNSRGVITAVNKPWLRFAEENEASHLVENFVGMNYLNVCAQAPLFAHGEEAASAQAGILAVLADTQNEFSLEYPCHSPDQQRWFRMRVTPLLDSQAGVVVAHENITERKQAQEKRYQSEAQLRAILDNSPSLIFLKDLDGRYLRVNREFEALFGKTEEEIVGRTDRDIFPPEQAAVYQGNDAKVQREGVPMLFEEVAFHGNNPHVSIVHKFPLRDKEGALYAIGGIATDITERKRAEDALREREETLARFKATLDQTHDCVFMFTSDSLLFIYCNRGAVEQVGYSEVELFTMTPLDLKPEFTERSFREMLQQLKDGRRDSHVFETIHRHKDGHDLDVEVSLQLVREEGQEGRFVAVVRDVTERKQAEEALRSSEERFDLAVRGSNTGIWDWDLRTGKTYFSPFWKSMLGYKEDELQGEFFEWEERLHPDDRERSLATVRAYLEGTTPQYELEHRLRHKDGSYRWILARGVSLSDAEGKPYRMAGSHIDITKQRQTQEALVQSEHQLRTVLDALPVGVWFTDRAGKTLLANPAAKQIWSNINQIGLQNLDNAVGWWEAIGPASEPHRCALSHVLETGVPSLNETFDFECLDGTKKTIRNSTVPVNSEDGVTLGAIVLNEDITLLRQAQAALQLTQFSVDHAVEGFLWIGPDARIFHVNDSICRMLEYTWGEFTTMALYDIDPNLSSELWSAHWEELRRNGSLTFESKYWSRTGRVLDTEVSVNYLEYEGKEYSCVIMRDIGERKQVQAALRASEERYRSLYDETPTMYFTLEVDGTVRSVNRFGAEQLGYQAEELIGHSVLGLFHEEDKEPVAASLSECLAAPEIARHWEFRKLRKDGSMMWVRETARVDQSSAEEPVVQVSCEDITEHKRAEHESRERVRQALAMQSALLELAHLDDTSLTFSAILPHVTRIVADMLAVERVSLWLLSEDQTELVCQDLYLRSQATHSVGSRLAASSYPRYLAVLKESLVIAAPNARVDQRTSEFADDYFSSLGITSVLDVPIRRQGKVVGVLWCEHVGVPREWTPEEQDFAASVGQTIVRMIEAEERKQAEEALRTKSQELDRYFTSALDLLCIADVTGHFKRLNMAWESTLGYPLEELEGAKFLDYVHPDDLEATLHALGDLTEQKEVLSFVNRYRRKDGSYRWIEWKSIPAGELIYASARDITERKRIEDALRARECELQTALQERERISQDLHDGILQSLFGVGLNLEVTKSLMPPTIRKTAGGSLDKSIDQLNRVMREIRNFIAGLGPDPIEGKDLSTALQSMLTSLTENQPTRVRLAVEKRAAQAVSAEQSIHLFRVIQEAVSNCIQHGGAQEARVSLKMLKQGVRLSIRDNGRGFNQDNVKAGGYGLRNMAARAQKISGRFTVLSKENEGTRIILDLPKEASHVSR